MSTAEGVKGSCISIDCSICHEDLPREMGLSTWHCPNSHPAHLGCSIKWANSQIETFNATESGEETLKFSCALCRAPFNGEYLFKKFHNKDSDFQLLTGAICSLNAAIQSENAKDTESLLGFFPNLIDIADFVSKYLVELPNITKAFDKIGGEIPSFQEVVKGSSNIEVVRIIDSERLPLLAAQEGNLECLKDLVEQGIDLTKVSLENERTLLHFASTVEVVEFLISLGLSVDARDQKGQTTLHTTASLEVAKWLQLHGVAISVTDLQNRTVLHTTPSLEIAQWLVDQGMSPDIRSSRSRTPLHTTDSAEVADFLIQKHNLPVGIASDGGLTPLHYVNNIEVAKVLLKHGAEINIRNEEQYTPLHSASCTGKANIVRCLIENGADLRAQDEFGVQPIHLASKHTDVLDVFIEVLPELLNETDNSNQTVLHTVDDFDLYYYLKTLGAEPVVDEYGDLPELEAYFIGDAEAVAPIDADA